MQMNLPMPVHGGAIRPGLATAGSFEASSSARRRRFSGFIVSAVMSGITPERSRTVPLASTRAGFSAPLAPYRISFMEGLFASLGGKGTSLIRPSAVDDLRRAGGEARFVARQVDRERGDLA